MGLRVERIRAGAAQILELVAQNVESALSEALQARGEASLCLAGGMTPRGSYEALARSQALDWSRLSIYFGDERCVPPEHPESNYRMAREALLDRVAVPEARIHRLRGENEDRDAAAREYEQLLPAEFDVLVLGIGEDGHTASLFPGAPAVFESERSVVPVTAPKPPPERLTLTPRALRSSILTVVVAAGAGKAKAVARALEGELDVASCPAQLFREAVWILDHAAAGELSGRWN